MPNALNLWRQEKKCIHLPIQKWQKCHPHVGDKGMAWLWTQTAYSHGIQQIYWLKQHLVDYPSPRHQFACTFCC